MKQDTDSTFNITVKVHNRPGVLVRTAQVFARRGYNIESLHVTADSKSGEYSTMTITAFGEKDKINQIVSQIHKLIDVVTIDVKET